ncbi:hypothetical protein D3C72_1443000 [compost metagenome]
MAAMAVTALEASPKMPSTPSPSFLTTRPPWDSMESPIHWVTWVTASVARSLPNVSYNDVLPDMSAKTTVDNTLMNGGLWVTTCERV